jgi:hypothetical protein
MRNRNYWDMAWVQVWSGDAGWIHTETIQMLSCSPLKKGSKKEDWIEVIAHPQQRVLLQTCLNVGTYPKHEEDRKAWNIIAENRARAVIAEVVRIIGDPKHHGRVIQLRSLYTLNFEKEPPKTVDIEVWVWDICCSSCKRYTPVVCPVGSHFGHSTANVMFANLSPLISGKYPFYKKTPALEKDDGEFASTCLNCGAPQDEWRVLESYLTKSDEGGSIVKKTTFTVPLTEEERASYAKPV